MKLVVNAYMSILIEGVAEALELADRLKVDPSQLADAIEGGPLDTPHSRRQAAQNGKGELFPQSSRWGLGPEGRGPGHRGGRRRRSTVTRWLLCQIVAPGSSRRTWTPERQRSQAGAQ